MSNTSQLRFTLNNPTLGPLVVNDPEGWDEAPLTLERDAAYSEVLEKYTSPLTFNQEAVVYLEQAAAMGIDTMVSVLVEISEDYGITWETFFAGLVELETRARLDWPEEYKIQYNVKKEDAWSIFMNRKSTPVDVRSLIDLDGATIAATTQTEIALPYQVLDRISKTRFTPSSAITDPADPGYGYLSWDFDATNKFGAFDLPEKVFDEVLTKFHLPNGTGPDFPAWLVECTEAGTFDFDISLNIYQFFAAAVQSPTAIPGYVNFYLAYGNDITGANLTKVPLVRTDIPIGVPTIVAYSNFSLVLAGIPLKITDKIWLYMEWGGPGAVTYNIFQDLGGLTNPKQYISIKNHSIFQDTVAKGFLIHDLVDGAIRRTCPMTLLSPLLGKTIHGYDDDGCGSNFEILLGSDIRDRLHQGVVPFAMSVDDLWAAVNAEFNAGLGVEGNQIYIDSKSAFFDKTGYSILLNNVNKVTQNTTRDSVYKSMKIGRSKWQLTAGASSIDDPQTIHNYASPLRYTGNPLTIDSKFIAASLLFELTRRAQTKPGETFDLDNDFFILKVLPDLSGPDLVGVCTDLLNYATRYNKTLTPARMLLRWINVLNVGHTEYIGKVFRFINGLGNTLTGVTVAEDCEDPSTVVENQNITITADVLHGVDTSSLDGYPMTWTEYKQIRGLKRKRIGISSGTTDHVFYFIKRLDFYRFKGTAKFDLLRDQ